MTGILFILIGAIIGMIIIKIIDRFKKFDRFSEWAHLKGYMSGLRREIKSLNYNDINSLKEVICLLESIPKKTAIKKFPKKYAQVMIDLGYAYNNMAMVMDIDKNTEKAISAFQEALKIASIKKDSMQYAQIQNGFGQIYNTLANVRDTEVNATKAIDALQKTLSVKNIQKNIELYALTCSNLGNAYNTLARVRDIEGNTTKAIDTFHKTMKIKNIQKIPIAYIGIQVGIGTAYTVLAEIRDMEENAEKAIDTFNEVLKNKIIQKKSVQYALIQFGLGKAYSTLAEVRDAKVNLNKAVDAFQEALKIYTARDYPIQHQMFNLILEKTKDRFSELKQVTDDAETHYKPLQKDYLKDKAGRPAAGTLKVEKTKYETKTYSNDKYGFSIKYPKGWALDILEPKPEFTVELSVWFGIRGKVACSIMVGPIGPTTYGRTPKELENRARLHRQDLNANLISSKYLTIDGVEAYEHVYTAKYPPRYVKQVGFFKGNDEYLLLFKVFSKEDFEKYEPIFDDCIQSFKFKREDRKQNIKKDDKESGSWRDPAYS